MSHQLINKTIEDLQLTGSLKIFYDFEDYSGSYINSVGYGDQQYSGEVVNYNSNFTGQASGSGCFNNQYISIKNTDQITSEAATIIFSQRKTGVSNGVIYGDLDEHGPSGWEVGINAANKLYFKNYINGSPNYVMLESYLSDQNACALSISEHGKGKLFRLNYEKIIENSSTLSFVVDNADQETSVTYYDSDTVEFNHLSHTISNGTNWKVGSGEFLYNGYLDNFLYFDRNLNDDQIRKLFTALYGDYSVIPAVSGTISGTITGYQEIVSGVSGVVGKPFNITGTGYNSGYYTYASGIVKTGCVGMSGIVYIPKTGIENISGTDQIDQNIYKKVVNLTRIFNVDGSVDVTGLINYESSGTYWHFSGNSGTFNGASATGPEGTIFGITGIESVIVTGYKSGYGSTLVTTGANSGLLYNVYTKSGLYGPDEDYEISGERIEYNRNPNPEYYANAISLIDESNEQYFYEIIYDADETQDLNEISKPYRSPKYSKYIAITKEERDNYNLNFFINGIAQHTGELTFGKNQFNFPTYTVSTGFNVLDNKVFTKDIIEENDVLIYDLVDSGNKNHYEITNLSQYSSRPFTSFDFSNADVFLNGVKIYSGIDYIDSGGFYPINNSTGTLGLYSTYPKYSGANSFTGYGNTGITIIHDAINPDSYCAFYNGIRQPKTNIIAHARYSDLISGTTIQESNNLLYTMLNGKTKETL